jgi:CRP-like cAMP-binding protein
MSHQRQHRRPAEIFHETPSLRGIPVSETDGFGPVRLLSNRQRQELAAIAPRMQVPARTIVYRQRTAAESVFIVADGVLKAFRELRNGKRPVLAFMFAEDIFGLAEAGQYVNTAETVTAATLFRISLAALKERLRSNAELELKLLAKVTHELREAQRHTLVVARRDAVGRVAVFLQTLEDHSTHRDTAAIDVPMTWADIAGYLGLSTTAFGRACRRLERSGVVAFPDRHTARILDRRQLEKLASGS